MLRRFRGSRIPENNRNPLFAPQTAPSSCFPVSKVKKFFLQAGKTSWLWKLTLSLYGIWFFFSIHSVKILQKK